MGGAALHGGCNCTLVLPSRAGFNSAMVALLQLILLQSLEKKVSYYSVWREPDLFRDNAADGTEEKTTEKVEEEVDQC